VGKNEITITCDYTAIPSSELKGKRASFVVLNRSSISFRTNEESQMRVELTFTNAGATRIPDARMVYLALDDDAGHNYLRRNLPAVDFRTLEPGQPRTFSDTFLSGAFMPGRYTIHLWIPDPDSSLRFDPTHNLLLGSAGVPDPKTGLNTLAQFAVRQ
jgi:hypothetical protein